MKKYRLWAVQTGTDIWVSRGTKEQVVRHITRSPEVRYYTVLNWVPIDASEKYSRNHASGWLYRAPVWLQKERLRKHQDKTGRCNKTVEQFISVILA